MLMQHNFTTENLVRFIYRETSVEEDRQIKQWIAEDAAASKQFQSLMESVSAIDMVELEPSETSVKIILEFSRESIEEESHA